MLQFLEFVHDPSTVLNDFLLSFEEIIVVKFMMRSKEIRYAEKYFKKKNITIGIGNF